MAFKYEEWNDKQIRSALPDVKVHFSKQNEYFTDTKCMVEVTDVRGEIIEIKTGPQDYIHLSIDSLMRCVKAHRDDYAESGA